eukprot:TRINITY_DN1624_c0_g1_i1.p1 TRINITY_DN1624_c0_g1~~TRINITY_DN1624_c0_g1_i1.p1  ORF type:complete len:265 (-),score=72.55 TRINITY_DN1624_c0_g1_i1:87-881(-)
MLISSETLAIITGASSGIGREVARRMATLGASILIVDLNQEGATETLKMLDNPSKHGFFKCDVSNMSEVKAIFDFSFKKYGKCFDILFNNAGVPENAFLFADNADDMKWLKIVDINLNAVLYGTKLGIAELKKAKKAGYIINTASMGALLPMIGTPVYAATKAAVMHMTRSLADLANEEIYVKAVCPTFTETPLIHFEGDHVVEAMKSAIGAIMPVEFVADSVLELVQGDSLGGAVMRVYMKKGTPTRDFYDSKIIPVLKKSKL